MGIVTLSLRKMVSLLFPHIHTSPPPPPPPQGSGGIVRKCWGGLEISEPYLLSQTGKLLPQVQNSIAERLFFMSSFLYQLKSSLLWKVNPSYSPRLDLSSHQLSQFSFPPPLSVSFFSPLLGYYSLSHKFLEITLCSLSSTARL